MPARKQMPNRPSKRKPSPDVPQESRAAEALTVFWMLTMMATLAAELASAAVWGLLQLAGKAEDLPAAVGLLPGLLMLIAVTTGILCLLLTPLAWHVRRQPPPLGVVVLAVVIGASPLLTLLVLRLASK